MRVVHVVVGPDGHGVVRHALEVAAACGHPVVRRATPAAVTPDDVTGHDVVHLSYTDKLYGPTAEDAASAFDRVATLVAATGAARSVTLHDLPAGTSDRAERRRRAYRSVVAGTRGVVVGSRHELALLDELDDGGTAWSRRVVPLPVDPVARPGTRADLLGEDVVVLGFVHPDRGHEHTIDETPAGGTVVALGATATGHDDLAVALATRARDTGRSWRLTGFVPDDELGAALRAAAVPVAPHRHVSASGSIATWLAHGRRPLVPDTRYARELEAAWPGTLRRYDPDRPGDLRGAIEASRADPVLTLRDPDARVGPSTAEVARQYRRHLAACAPPATRRLGGRYLVPGNRWDLLADVPDPSPPTVSVVVPYYERQGDLDLVLAALARQTHPASRLQVVVADDGSSRAPDLGAADGLAVRAVRQPDHGFRAAAARNLGARACEGDVLAFLDGDTVPEPGYLAALSRLPALSPDALVVGRRRHADPDAVADWLAGRTPSPVPLDEPAWLAEGYGRSGDLLDADARSYRYVISAVLGLPRALFTEIGGFAAEEFHAYGGEDWELAARAWHAGAALAHVGDAVAWHLGPDWAGRGGAASAKAVETRTLARLVPDPTTRRGAPHRHPAAVVLVDTADPEVLAAAVRTAHREALDVGFWLTDPSGCGYPDAFVRRGHPPAAVLARAGTVVRLTGAGPLGPLLAGAGEVRSTPAGTAWPSRGLGRAARWAGWTGEDPETLVEALVGRRDLTGTEVDHAGPPGAGMLGR